MAKYWTNSSKKSIYFSPSHWGSISLRIHSKWVQIGLAGGSQSLGAAKLGHWAAKEGLGEGKVEGKVSAGICPLAPNDKLQMTPRGQTIDPPDHPLPRQFANKQKKEKGKGGKG